MSGSNRFSRVLSLRDKRHPPAKPKSPTSDFHGLFTLDVDAKKLSKDEEKKVQDITQRLASLGNHHVPETRIGYALRTKHVAGDVVKALDLIMLFEDSVGGVLRPYNPQMKMLGAENYLKVTCWADALLFAMFAKSNVFEALLYKEYEDQPRKRLVITLRLYINMLRTGRLITTDVTRQLQSALANAGWSEAGTIKQQDASEAFGFITDKLDLPLLTLKTDIYHAGNDDDDDHRFITERLLDVAIPEEVPQDGVVSLESCLEEYFNYKVEITRQLQRRNTLNKTADRDGEKNECVHVDCAETNDKDSISNPSEQKVQAPATQSRPSLLRGRAPSIFSERRINTLNGVAKEGAVTTNGRHRQSSIRKEVLMPAWQFLNLIPWYTDNNNNTDAHAKAHFSSQRPMLGICLKRYKVDKNGIPSRLKTKVDIPLEMRPPHFAAENNGSDESGLSSDLKLTLQAVVCHRGNYVTSGHYIALVRDTSRRRSTQQEANGTNAAQDTWLRLDDIAAERVSTVDIEQALQNEWPYLLFYQVLPIEHEEHPEQPPPYSEPSEQLDIVGEKLAGLQSNSRKSLELADWTSRRASIALSDGTRSRTSQPDVLSPTLSTRNDNATNGIIMEQVSSTPPNPHDDVKADGAPSPRPQRRTKGSRPNSDASDKLFSRITSRLSRDKLAGTEVIVTDELEDDGVSFKESESKPKERERKSIFKGGSLVHKKKGPDRECRMM